MAEFQKNFGRVVGYNTIPANVTDNTAILLSDAVGSVGDFCVDMGTSEVYRISAVEGGVYTVGESLGVIVDVDLTGYIPTSEKGTAGGVATLDDSGLVPSSELPSYVDDVLEYDSFDDLPKPGEDGKIYVTTDDNKQYRWGGSDYVQISESLALGETHQSAYYGDLGKIAYDHSQETGNPHSTTLSDIVGTNAIGDTSTPVFYSGTALTSCTGVASTQYVAEYVTEQIAEVDHTSAIVDFFNGAQFSLNTDGELIMTVTY